MANWLPNKFLCAYSLKTGAFVAGILMACVLCIWTIALLLKLVHHYSGRGIWYSVYAEMVVICLDCVILLVINFWLLWGVKHEKTSVILVWLVATVLWLAHSFVIVGVMLIIYFVYANFIVWILYVALTIAAFAIAVYVYLCVYAFWQELLHAKCDTASVPA